MIEYCYKISDVLTRARCPCFSFFWLKGTVHNSGEKLNPSYCVHWFLNRQLDNREEQLAEFDKTCIGLDSPLIVKTKFLFKMIIPYHQSLRWILVYSSYLFRG